MNLTARTTRFVVATLLAALSAAGGARGEAPSAQRRLADLLADDRTALPAMAALRSTDDPQLVELLAAMIRSGDKRMRLYAAGALGDFDNADATAALLEALRNDSVTIVRSEALLSLLKNDAMSDAQLAETLAARDESLQCLAARALIERGRDAAARPVLERLTESRDPATEALSRMSLLGLGDTAQLHPLQRIILADGADEQVVAMLMNQISAEGIARAAPLARAVARGDGSLALRVQAWRAYASVGDDAEADDAGRELLAALTSSDHIVLRLHLLRAISERDDAAMLLRELSAGDGPVGALARFELARPAGGDRASREAREAMALEHPIVVDYLVESAVVDADSENRDARFYVPALLAFVRSVPDRGAMRREHALAARAVTLLADLGSPEAMDALAELCGRQYNPRTRAVAAGLMKSNNRAVCNLVRDWLDSPYEELATDAAFTLGRFAEPSARAPLERIVSRPSRYRPELVALAGWYLLALDGRTAPAVRELAGVLR